MKDGETLTKCELCGMLIRAPYRYCSINCQTAAEIIRTPVTQEDSDA